MARARCTLSLVAALCVIAPGGTAVPNAKVGVGVNFSCRHFPATEQGAVFAALQHAGAQWVRLEFPWFLIEPTARGQYDGTALAEMSDCIDRARAFGLKVLVVLYASPRWDIPAGARWSTPPANVQDYADTAGRLARAFAGRVDAWEIWNEANIPAFWTGSVAQFVALARAAYPAIKEGDPAATVVLGGTAYNDAEWVAAAYAAGVKGAFDALAVHPYTSATNDFESIGRVHEVMLANGDDSPMWVTEMGWSLDSVDEATQAQDLLRAFEYLQANCPYVADAFWFEAAPFGSGPWEDGMALLNPDLTPRPALAALHTYAAE